MRLLITIFLWSLVLLVLASAIVPLTNSGLLPFFQIFPSFDLLFWFLSLFLLFAASVRRYRPVLSSVTFLLATLLVAWRGYGSMPEYTERGGEELKVLSLNVGQFNNDTGEVRMTIQEIRRNDPDILCLQEFGLYYKWPDVESVAKDFSERIGMKHYDFSPHKGNIFGTAVFSKFPIIETDTIFNMLSATNEAKRYTFNVNGKELRLTNVHLQSYNLFGRQRSPGLTWSGRISETLSRRKSQVNVLMRNQSDIVVGDLNASVGSYYYESLAGKWRDVQRAFGQGLLPTHALVPTRLDYIFTRKQMRTINFERLTDFPSDHYGLMATVAI